MKINLKIKLILPFFLFLVLLFSLQAIILEKAQSKLIEKIYKEKSKAVIQALNIGLGLVPNLENSEELFLLIQKVLFLNPDVTEINISALTQRGPKILASSNPSLINTYPSSEDLQILQGKISSISKREKKDGKEIYSFFFPLESKGKIIGSCNFKISFESLQKIFQEFERKLIASSGFSVLFLLLIFYPLLQREIFIPLFELKRVIGEIAQGNLEAKIKIKKKDELGELGEGLDQMREKIKDLTENLKLKIKEKSQELEEKVKELEKTKEELEEAKLILEVKVAARTRELGELNKSLEEQIRERTKELQKRLEELEKFQKLAVARELKMIELKKQIEELKAKLKEEKS